MHVEAHELGRLMTCGLSRTMPQYYPPQGAQSEDARYGVAAHWLASEYLKGNITDLDEWVDRKASNGHYMDIDLVDHVRWFVEGVLRDRSSHFRLVEADMTAWNADRSITIGARPDVLTDDRAEYGRRIRVHDLKMGFTIVEPERNWQLLAYCAAYVADKTFAPDTMFELYIWQPRPGHPNGPKRVWIIDAAHFSALRDEMFATLATNTQIASTSSYCTHCPAITNCWTNRKLAFNMMDITERGLADEMSLDEMSRLKDQLSSHRYSLKALDDALEERITDAITRGQTVRNYRLQPYEGARDWRPGIDADTLSLLLPGKTVSKPAPLLTPTQLKKAFPPNVLESLTYRKPGGVKLRRMDMDQHAQSMFGNNPTEDTQ